MSTVFRASLLFVFVSSLVSVGCATPPKPRELVALEQLRASPNMAAARKKAPNLCKKSDMSVATATDKWQSDDLNESVNAALMGQIYTRHALALVQQDKAKARIAAAEDALSATAEEQEKASKDLDDVNEKIELLEKQAKKDQEVKALEAQIAADKKATADKLAQEKLRSDTAAKIADAELALKTAETLNAPKYASETYKSATEILAKAHSEMDAGQMEQAQASAAIAKKTAEDAAQAAKPSYERDSQAAENRKKADALFADASQIPGVSVRRDMRGSLQRIIVTIPDKLLFVKRQTVISPAKESMLDPIAALIKKKDYASFPVQIIGYTDSRGRQSRQLALSGARAQSVYNALVTRGVDVKRLMASGQGGAEPIADGRSAAGRAANYRIEVVFLYQ